MKTVVRPVLIVAAISAAASAQSPVKVDALQFSPAVAVAELDMGKLKGEPARLAWSSDGGQFYLQTVENRGRPNMKTRHYAFSAADGKKQDLDAEPSWAAEYWTMKSGQAPPDRPALKIEVKTEQRQQRTTSAPMGGDLARGGVTPGEMGTSAGDAGAAAYGAQAATVHSMVLLGKTIGEFANSVIVPGLTFGWGPKGTGVIAYTEPKSGKVMVMDYDGKQREVSGAKDALLPAWSHDGRRLAWVERNGRRTFVLKVADLTTGS